MLGQMVSGRIAHAQAKPLDAVDRDEVDVSSADSQYRNNRFQELSFFQVSSID